VIQLATGDAAMPGAFSWITNGKVSAVGIGMVIANDLAGGWRGVAE
jgi:isoaspartyl peptidase/L-asparaginase-like protein (Ntn-hydrolase superfamily)